MKKFILRCFYFSFSIYFYYMRPKWFYHQEDHWTYQVIRIIWKTRTNGIFYVSLKPRHVCIFSTDWETFKFCKTWRRGETICSMRPKVMNGLLSSIDLFSSTMSDIEWMKTMFSFYHVICIKDSARLIFLGKW